MFVRHKLPFILECKWRPKLVYFTSAYYLHDKVFYKNYFHENKVVYNKSIDRISLKTLHQRNISKIFCYCKRKKNKNWCDIQSGDEFEIEIPRRRHEGCHIL